MKKYVLFFIAIVFVMPVNHLIAQTDHNVITFLIGDFQVSTLVETQSAGKPNILIGANQADLQKYLPDGTFPSEINAFLVRTPDKNILVDTGLGINLLSNLQSLGLTAEQIDVILLTHVHGDHIGGLLHDGKAAFPNAVLYLSEAEYVFWTGNQQSLPIIDAYKDRITQFEPVALDSEESSLFAGFRGIKAYGHTPGHTVYLVESNGERLLIWGDLTHVTPVQMPHPEIAVTYDSNAQDAIASRLKILEYVSAQKIPVAGMHIVFPAIGNVTVGKEGYDFEPFCTCLGY
ncbi:MAG: MBL fold metallo-hydrolase [Dysgonamonadaceae bacterium]|jgi:glyoxylase-like metal-dependent hydrolase (beta-lactamase superfamily II)|nr:MBL fold metallo-hydrolase [Dysgonamonadaceae bacterium]